MPELMMKPIDVKPKLQEKGYYTKGMAYDLEKHLMERGITAMGNEAVGKEKRRMKNGKLRAHTWEMKGENRVMRTLIIKNGVTETELRDWHEYEKENCWKGYLLCTTRELKNVIRPKVELPKIKWTDNFVEYVMQYVKKHHPQYRKYDGFPVPPYFIYDMEFEGMEFEHALDWKLFYGEPINLHGFVMAETKNKQFKD